jgi:hypothetical protein
MPRDALLHAMVVDDHELFRSGLRALLDEEGFETADEPARVRPPGASRRGTSWVALGRGFGGP